MTEIANCLDHKSENSEASEEFETYEIPKPEDSRYPLLLDDPGIQVISQLWNHFNIDQLIEDIRNGLTSRQETNKRLHIGVINTNLMFGETQSRRIYEFTDIPVNNAFLRTEPHELGYKLTFTLPHDHHEESRLLDMFREGIKLYISNAGLSLLIAYPKIISDLFDLNSTRPEHFLISNAKYGDNRLYRITLACHWLMVKRYYKTDRETGLFQMEAFQFILQKAKEKGCSIEQVYERLRIGESLDSDESLAVTAPVPFFATYRTLVMSDLRLFTRYDIPERMVWRAKRDRLGLKFFPFHESLYYRDEIRGADIVAIVDIHNL